MNEARSKYSRLATEAFLPSLAEVVETADMTARDRYFRVALPSPLGHRPGQFVMVSVLGVGEAPISISCGPSNDNMLEMVIRRVGRLTQVIHELEVGEELGIRGPYGSGFDLEEFRGKDVLFVAGGLGLAPLRSLIEAVTATPDEFGRVTLISGCRNPAEELYRERLDAWQEADVEVIRLVDRTENMPWSHRVGLVTDPIPSLSLDPKNTIAALCGPPVMYKFVIMALGARQIGYSQIFVDLERQMKCGVGKCGHCQINEVYCCQEGPVFRFSDIVNLPEALR